MNKNLIFTDPKERFWSRVIKTDYCWNWNGTKRGNYGCLEIDGVLTSAHRFSWEIHFGKIINNLNVLHKCDNTICVNPEHLFLGTISDNNKDRARKNRSWRPKGVLHPLSKLTENDIRNIRSIYKNKNLSQRAIAKIFNVSQECIRKILKYITWSHIK